MLAAKTTREGRTLKEKTIEIVKDGLKAGLITNIALSAASFEENELNMQYLVMSGTIGAVLIT